VLCYATLYYVLLTTPAYLAAHRNLPNKIGGIVGTGVDEIGQLFGGGLRGLSLNRDL